MSTPTVLPKTLRAEHKSISVFPNPASQSIQIRDNNITISSVAIYNLKGEVVLELFSNREKTIKVANLAGGLYLVTITSEDGQSYQAKVIKNQH